jgi:signal peptidase I
MNKTLFKGIAIFLLGVLFSQLITPLSSLANTERPLDNGQPLLQSSPEDRISESQIIVTQDKVVINLQDAKWAKFTDTHSMEPVLDKNSNAIQVKAEYQQLKVGDIISYKPNGTDYLIIHRIIEISEDENGWYCYVKGDNNKEKDPDKVRADQVEKVVVAIIY